MSSDGAATGRDGEPVEVAYLVLAHRRPAQVVRLAERIRELSPSSRVLIHWDRRAREVLDPALLPERAVVIPERIAARWGSWSLVEATLALFRAATSASRQSWCVLISGEDWPVVDLASWESRLGGLDADAIVFSSRVDDRWAKGERNVPLPEDEVRRYSDRWHIIRSTGWPWLDRAGRGVARRLSSHVRPRSYPAVFDFYGRGVAVSFRPASGVSPGWTLHRGEQWVTLNARAVSRVLGVDSRATDHFRMTLIPDESYVHTILHNDPDVRVVPGHTSFAPWKNFGRVPHLVLRSEDLADVRGSGAPFARKVGEGEFAAIVEELDRLVERARRGVG